MGRPVCDGRPGLTRGRHRGKNSSRRGPALSAGRGAVRATGDLARRKLLPGLFHLASAGFIPGCRIIGVSLDEFGVDDFRASARGALGEFSSRKVTEAYWAAAEGPGPGALWIPQHCRDSGSGTVSAIKLRFRSRAAMNLFGPCFGLPSVRYSCKHQLLDLLTCDTHMPAAARTLARAAQSAEKEKKRAAVHRPRRAREFETPTRAVFS